MPPVFLRSRFWIIRLLGATNADIAGEMAPDYLTAQDFWDYGDTVLGIAFFHRYKEKLLYFNYFIFPKVMLKSP